MAEIENAAATTKKFDVVEFLTFRGEIGRGWYFLGLGAELALLFVALASLAGLNNPTGGGSFELLIIFAIAGIWLHLALVTARVRHARGPVIVGLLLGAAPFVFFILMAESIESRGILILIVVAALYLLPGLFPRRPVSETGS